MDVEELFDEHVVEDHVGGEFEQYTVTIIHLPSGWPVRWIFDRSVTMFDDNGKDQSTLHQEVKLAED